MPMEFRCAREMEGKYEFKKGSKIRKPPKNESCMPPLIIYNHQKRG